MKLGDRLRRTKLEAYYGLRGKKRYSYYRQLVRNERLSREAMQRLAWERLSALVEHAYRTVPYYQALFEREGLSPSDIRSYRDFERIPKLTKQQVRESASRLVCTTAEADSYHPHSSGGSTGVPVHFHRSWDYEEHSNFAGAFRSAHRTGWEPGEKIAWFWGRPVVPDLAPPEGRFGRLRRSLGDWVRDSGVMMFDAFNAGPEAMETWLSRLRRERPRTLYGYASALRSFAQFLKARGERLDGVRGVISTAEALHPEDRQLFQEVLGGVVIDQYGSREICSIATSCAAGVLHVNTDMVHLEFEDIPGQERLKKLIVTDLHNKVFPFLRYEIGDCGVMTSGESECSCGLPFPTLHIVIGRTFDNFISPEGRVVHGAFFKILMDKVPGIEQFQFRQVRREHIVLSLVKAVDFGEATQAYLSQVRERIAAEFSERAALELEFVERIRAPATGKFRYTICEIDREKPAAEPGREAGAIR